MILQLLLRILLGRVAANEVMATDFNVTVNLLVVLVILAIIALIIFIARRWR